MGGFWHTAALPNSALPEPCERVSTALAVKMKYHLRMEKFLN